jgi:hypothetical protein
MPNKLPRLKLSHEEDNYLRHWIFDEAHYEKTSGAAKRLQLQHHAVPADLAALIAAAFPDLAEQETIGNGPPPDPPPVWPWPGNQLRTRLREAEAILATRRKTIVPAR